MPTRINFPSKREARQKSAAARQERFETLTLEQRLALLDQRLGKGVGAARQRARIAAQIVERDTPKPEPVKKAKPDGKPRRRSKPKKGKQ